MIDYFNTCVDRSPYFSHIHNQWWINIILEYLFLFDEQEVTLRDEDSGEVVDVYTIPSMGDVRDEIEEMTKNIELGNKYNNTTSSSSNMCLDK